MMGSEDYFCNETKKLSPETVVQQEVTATNTNSLCVDIVETVLSYCACSIHRCEKTGCRELLQMTTGERGRKGSICSHHL